MQQAIKHFEVYELYKMTPYRILFFFSIIFVSHHFSWHFNIVALVSSDFLEYSIEFFWAFVSNYSAVSRLPDIKGKEMLSSFIALTDLIPIVWKTLTPEVGTREWTHVVSVQKSTTSTTWPPMSLKWC